MRRKVILAGGTGTMGVILQAHFAERGDEVVVLTRNTNRSHQPHVRLVAWDARTSGPWCSELQGADVVINLAGKSVDCRYSAANRTEILESRTRATRVLGEAIGRCSDPPALWVNMSSATVYRHAEDRAMDEETGELGKDFSPQVVLAWEKEFFARAKANVRQVAVRSAMVFSQRGGAFPRFAQLTRMGLGGHHGSGKQYVSWVHEEDVKRFFQWLIETPTAEGIINLAAPNPLHETDLMRGLRDRIKPAVFFNVPAWVLPIGAWFMRTEVELVLKSRRVVPAKAMRLG
ncbi:MAG TPA: TIGR01777 family oxidoreductase, partial [Flavobacteriales bacterium]|nr:TIGR01777 family oxidoreductase [Flavobacteriales bacterium]